MKGGEKLMQKLIYRIGAALTSATLIGYGLAPAIVLADTTVDIIGNGADSTNTALVNNTCTVDVTQKNKTKVYVDATVVANTGGNEANNNTGSGVTTSTGDATASATISVGGSSNSAVVPSCCECLGNTNVTIQDNGTGTTNTSNNTNSNSTTTYQKNKTKVKAKVKVKAKTGKNKANNNTGGTVDTSTGSAGASLGVTVDPSSNTLTP